MPKYARSQSNPVFKSCDHPDCTNEGEYRAPKSRLHVEEGKPSERYYHFCLQHVREYNKRWDYFAQMSMDEIDRFQRDAVVGHRKTKPISGRNQNLFFNTKDAWFFGINIDHIKPTEAPKPKLTKPQRTALALLALNYPFTQAQLKARYRMLAKKHHPDANGGDTKAEEIFKDITESYRILKDMHNT